MCLFCMEMDGLADDITEIDSCVRRKETAESVCLLAFGRD